MCLIKRTITHAHTHTLLMPGDKWHAIITIRKTTACARRMRHIKAQFMRELCDSFAPMAKPGCWEIWHVKRCLSLNLCVCRRGASTVSNKLMWIILTITPWRSARKAANCKQKNCATTCSSQFGNAARVLPGERLICDLVCVRKRDRDHRD